MIKLYSILIFLISANTIAQELVVVADGEDAHCRLFGYQNGNGIVYAIPSGGVPDYTYEWTNLTTGETNTNTTWGGLNIGCYEIKVTDMDGAIARDTVCLDSINPVAEFLVVSAELESMEWAYVGDAPVNVSFHTAAAPVGINTFLFRPQGFELFEVYEDEIGEFTTYNYIYGGDFTATMIAINNNGCTDTSHARIYLSGPLEINESNKLDFFTITSHSNTGSISINKQGYANGLQLNLYTLSGQNIRSVKITEEQQEFQIPSTKGIYLYEMIDLKTGQKAGTGKVQL